MSRILVATRVGAPGSYVRDELPPAAWGHGVSALEGTRPDRVEGRWRAVLVGQYARNCDDSARGTAPDRPPASARRVGAAQLREVGQGRHGEPRRELRAAGRQLGVAAGLR